MPRHLVLRILLAIVACTMASSAFADEQYRTLWARQRGTSDYEAARSIAVLTDGAIITVGDIQGRPPVTALCQSCMLGHVSRYSRLGELQWTRTVGTPDGVAEYVWAVAPASGGHALIAGNTGGSLFGPVNGDMDAFIARIDQAGNIVWGRQYGTTGIDTVWGIAVDSTGAIYATGSTSGELGGTLIGEQDLYLAKFDNQGSLLWARQIGSPQYERSAGVTVDEARGAVLIAGTTLGSLAAPLAGTHDAVVAAYSMAGDFLWVTQWGGPWADSANSIAADAAGNAFVTGYVNMSATPFDAAIHFAKLSPSGQLLWVSTISSAGLAGGSDITVRSDQSVVIVGVVNGPILPDVAIYAFGNDGAPLWNREIGTSGIDEGQSLATTSDGLLYVAGATNGNLGAPSAGNMDTFLLKLGPPCPPDMTATAVAGQPGYGEPDARVTADDFQYYLAQFAAGNLAVADLTTTAVPGSPGYGVPNGVLNNDDFFYYLTIFAAGC